MRDTITVQTAMYCASSLGLEIIDGGMIAAVLYSGGRMLVRTYDVVVVDFCELDFAAAGERWSVSRLKRES